MFHIRGGAVTGGDERVAGVILASGMSTRFGQRNKLLVPVDGIPVVRRVVATYLDAVLDPVVVVVGHEESEVLAALEGLIVTAVRNADFRHGQSRALVAGVRALSENVGAAVIGVADQPFLSAALIRSLVEEWRRGRPLAVAPLYDRERGNPILYDRRLFPELLQVTGDQGGRAVFRRHAHEAVLVAAPHGREGMDVDTVEDLGRLMGPEG
jgi:molybdenum cofactor cytidylyltransferase